MNIVDYFLNKSRLYDKNKFKLILLILLILQKIISLTIKILDFQVKKNM